MKAGDLRHRVTIQQNASTARDSTGSKIDDWQPLATVWASVDFLSGREYFASQQTNAETTVRIRVRYRSDVLPTMRAVFEEHTFDIQAVIPDAKKRELQLMCKEVV